MQRYIDWINKEVRHMFFMITSTYPPTKASEVVQVFGKSLAEPLPSFLKRLHVLTTGGAGEPGIKTYSIFESDKGKEYETLAELTRRMGWFYTIEGWRYQIETLFAAEEAIPLLELKAP
jgi:hypothetical protein